MCARSVALLNAAGQSMHADWEVAVRKQALPDEHNTYLWIEPAVKPRLTSVGCAAAPLDMDCLVLTAHDMPSRAASLPSLRRPTSVPPPCDLQHLSDTSSPVATSLQDMMQLAAVADRPQGSHAGVHSLHMLAKPERLHTSLSLHSYASRHTHSSGRCTCGSVYSADPQLPEQHMTSSLLSVDSINVVRGLTNIMLAGSDGVSGLVCEHASHDNVAALLGLLRQTQVRAGMPSRPALPRSALHTGWLQQGTPEPSLADSHLSGLRPVNLAGRPQLITVQY